MRSAGRRLAHLGPEHQRDHCSEQGERRARRTRIDGAGSRGPGRSRPHALLHVHARLAPARRGRQPCRATEHMVLGTGSQALCVQWPPPPGRSRGPQMQPVRMAQSGRARGARKSEVLGWQSSVLSGSSVTSSSTECSACTTPHHIAQGSARCSSPGRRPSAFDGRRFFATLLRANKVVAKLADQPATRGPTSPTTCSVAGCSASLRTSLG